jgi:membrane-associated phospholipid phosphatase
MKNIRRQLLAFTALAVAFMALSALVAAGVMRTLDRDVSSFMTHIWWQPLQLPFQGLALLGGIEITILVGLGLAIWLWRRRFGVDALAPLALPAAVVVEVLYKRIVDHPAPPLGVEHGDGPSLSMLFERTGVAGSFPSGHVVRAVVAYGLLAFVIARLSRRHWVGRLAILLAILLIAAESFDRLYLNVHWESDVFGGLLLGGLALAGAIIWLDRPRGAT